MKSEMVQWIDYKHLNKKKLIFEGGLNFFDVMDDVISLTLTTLADRTSSIGLTISIGSTRVVMTWVQGAAVNRPQTF